MPRLVYIPPRGGAPHPVDVPPIPEIDEEIGRVYPHQPFEVEDNVAVWMLGPRGNVNFYRYVEPGEKLEQLVDNERRFTPEGGGPKREVPAAPLEEPAPPVADVPADPAETKKQKTKKGDK